MINYDKLVDRISTNNVALVDYTASTLGGKIVAHWDNVRYCMIECLSLRDIVRNETDRANAEKKRAEELDLKCRKLEKGLEKAKRIIDSYGIRNYNMEIESAMDETE